MTKSIRCLCGALAALFLLPLAAGNVCAQEQSVLRWGADPSGGAPYVYADPSRPDEYIGYEIDPNRARCACPPKGASTGVPGLQTL